jgi:hypothetical protein
MGSENGKRMSVKVMMTVVPSDARRMILGRVSRGKEMERR